MPELPEVEHFRRLAARSLVGGIEAVEAFRDEKVFQTPAAALVGALQGAQVRAFKRHGKHLALVLDGGAWIHLRFGMTGALRARSSPSLVLAGTPESGAAWPPKFTKLLLTMSDDAVAFTSVRRFARIALRPESAPFPPPGLGFDALTGDPSHALGPALAGRRGTIKGALLNQCVCAGLGNWLVDEVLREAQIHPEEAVPSLDKGERQRVAVAIEQVIGLAVAANAEAQAFPAHWLFHLRWGGLAGAKTRDGAAIAEGRVAGRKTLWVPEELKSR